MLCEKCQQRDATVHLNMTVPGVEYQQPPNKEQHFCPECADVYFASTPAMNSARGLICLSDSYRSKLYDLLEATHPEVFDSHDTEACRRGSELMRGFLREQLKHDRVEVSGDAFDMLCQDFFCSHHFYTRLDEFNRQKR